MLISFRLLNLVCSFCVYLVYAIRYTCWAGLIHISHLQSDIEQYSVYSVYLQAVYVVLKKMRMLQCTINGKFKDFFWAQQKKKKTHNLIRFFYVSEVASETNALIYLTTIISDKILAMNVLYLLREKAKKKIVFECSTEYSILDYRQTQIFFTSSLFW